MLFGCRINFYLDGQVYIAKNSSHLHIVTNKLAAPIQPKIMVKMFAVVNPDSPSVVVVVESVGLSVNAAMMDLFNKKIQLPLK